MVPALTLALLIWLSTSAWAQEEIVRFGTTVVVSGGLQGTLYKIKHTQHLPDFEKLKPVGTIYTHSLNVPPQSFLAGFPGVTKRFEWFAIDYTGRFWVEHPGSYKFMLSSDDGSRLYIDDKLVIDNDGLHAIIHRPGQVTLGQGVHSIRVSYFQGPKEFLALILQVSRPGESMRIFNTDEWKPPAGADVPQQPMAGQTKGNRRAN